MPFGLKSKTSLTAWAIRSSETTPVPSVLTMMEVGWATPIA